MSRQNDAEILVVPEPAQAAAELLAEAAREGAGIALSGGSTPGPAYRLAGELCPNWSAAEIWFCDERAVPPSDPRSNYRLVEESLLSRLASAPGATHRIRGELAAEEAAQLYEHELRGANITLAVNGIGPDGHTASLFPDSAALAEVRRAAVAAPAQLEPFVDRITLTRPAFQRVDRLVYLVVGREKADAVRRAFAEPPDTATPASLVRGRRTLALLDPAAASALP